MPQKFLFVNPENQSSKQKVPVHARSFVIRKARAEKAAKKGSARAHALTQRAIAPKEEEDQLVSLHVSDGLRDTALYDDVSIRKTLEAAGTLHCFFCGRVNSPVTWGNIEMEPCQFCQPSYVALPRPIDSRPDPFASLAVGLEDRDDLLLSYFTTAIQPSLDLLRYWLAPSFSHPGIMHGMLCLAAIQLGVEWPEEPRHFERFMYHRIQAIAAVHQDLAGPQQALSDGNIATVFCLLSAEENLHAHAIAAHAGAWQHLQPDPAQRAAHLAGLKQMLALRGGVISLGNTRAVQSFVIRWARTARNCRLVCLIPQAMPSPTAAEDAANQAGAILTDSYVWPDDLLKQVHSHPSYTVSSLYGSRMASICKEAGMSRILVSVIFAVDCQIKSAGTWLSSRQNHTWDAIDIQNLFATSIGNLACWILEHEGTLTPAENVTALCAFVVVCWTSGGSTSFHGLPGVLPRLRRYLRVQGVKQALQAAGLHAWVGILIYIMSTNVPEDEDYFFRAYLQLLAQGQPLIQTLGDLKTSLSTCIWISQSLDQYAETVWFHTSDTIHDLQATSIEDAELITTAARPLTPPFYIKPALPLAMPYTMAALNSMSGDDGPIWKSFLED